MSNTVAKVVKSKDQWEAFVKGDVLNFLIANDIEKIQVDDGCGRKGVIKRNAQGDYITVITSKETL
jgi:hypothetical protein